MKIINLAIINHQEIINETLEALRSGGLVVFPTDTVYGLLCDATNPQAVDKLLAFKERPVGKAISVFMANEKMAKDYITSNPNADNIIKNLLPGPFTIICQSSSRVKRSKIEGSLSNTRERDSLPAGPLRQPCKQVLAGSEASEAGARMTKEKRHSGESRQWRDDSRIIDSRLLAENGTLGFRIPDYPLILDLVRQFGKPLTATSANISSTPPHYSIESFLSSSRVKRSKIEGSLSPTIEERDSSTKPALSEVEGVGMTKKTVLINLIIDAGKLPHNKPSTVIDTTSGELKTLRFGDLLPSTPNSLISHSENETLKLAQFILSKTTQGSAGKPIVFLLQGELGTGKTIFTKGLGKALGIQENIVSPTFTICYEYKVPLSFQRSETTSGIYKNNNYIDSRLPASRQGEHGNDNEWNDKEFPTKFPHLYQDSPIGNDNQIDVFRLNHNTNIVEQNPKNKSKRHPESRHWRDRGIPFACYEERDSSTKPALSEFISSGLSLRAEGLSVIEGVEGVGMTNPLLIHYDLYRIESPEDLKEIKFLESIKPENIYSIEWPERIDENTLSKLKEITHIIYINIRHIDENTREFQWGF